MAADARVTLEVIMKALGIKATTKQIKEFNAAGKKTSEGLKLIADQSNKVNRNLRGIRQSSGSVGKDFSRMQQGMGGLVAAYATVAANVFALSSAFLVLRRAADLSSMIKSAEDFSNRFGVSVTRITKQMQEASGGALSFAEALPIINKAVSAGIPVEKLEALTVAATKAAQTFGGSATEALNRFISASQRGRVEIIQTLGIVIKTEQAYKDYGASIGKTALELSAFDRQQAILNATIKESQNVFDGIGIDPNPFQQLLTTVIDLKDTMSTFITDAITPMLNAFNKSKAAAGALIALIIGTVAKRIFPALGDQIAELQKKSIASTTKATAALAAAEEKKVRVILKTDRKLAGLTKSQLLGRTKLFKNFFAERLSLHKSFGKSLVTEEGKINAAILNEQRSAITKELNIRAGVTKGKRNAAFRGISNETLENQRNARILLTKETKNATAAQDKLTKAETVGNQVIRRRVALLGAATAKMNASVVSFRSQLTTGFSKSFATTQTRFILATKNMGLAWGVFIRRAIIQTKGAQTAFEAFGRAVGRTAGFVAGAFARAINLFSSLALAVSLGFLVWEKYGDSIRGITPGMRAVIDAGEELEDALNEVNERTAEGITRLGKEMPESLKKLQDALKFTSGTFASITSAIVNFQKVTIKSLGNLTPGEAIGRIKELKAEIESIETTASKDVIIGGDGRLVAAFPAVIAEIKKLKAEAKDLDGVLKILADTSTKNLIKAFEQSTDLAKNIGLTNIGALISKELEKSTITEGPVVGQFFDLEKAFESGDPTKILKTLETVKASFGDNSAEFSIFVDSLFALVTGFNSSVIEVTSATDRAIGSLTEVGGNITTFIGGLDKLRAASGPNKEITAFILDINRELITIDKLQNSIAKNDKLAEIFKNVDELASIKALLGFAKDDIVTIGQAQKRAQKIQTELLAQQQAMALRGDSLKVLAIEISNIKAREVKTDKQRLAQIRDRLAAERKVTALLLSNAEVNIAAQERVLISKQNLEATKAELVAEESKLNVFKAQRNELLERQRVQAQNLDFEREEAKIIDETLKSLKTINSIWSKIIGIRKKISVSNTKDLAARKRLFSLRLESFDLEKRILDQQILTFDINKNTAEQNLKILGTLEAQLELIEAQEEVFRRTALILEARNLDQSGETFTKEGMVVLGQVFSRTIRDGVRDLKPVLVSLGEGFANAVTGTFDAAVDKLFEGHGFSGFRAAVAEAFKEGLREAFSTSIKDRIKDAFASLKIFEEKPRELTEAEKEAIAARKDMIQRIKDSIAAQIENTKALREVSAALGGATVGGIKPQQSPLPESDAITIFGPIVSAIDNGTLETTKASETAKEGIGTLAGIFVQFITGLISSGGGGGGFVEGVGAIFKTIFGAANGGVIKGGMSPIPQLATGGVTNGAQLAVIGEGNTREAVVPLPNNREIPVDLKGSGGGDTITIEQNFDFRNADASTITQLRNQAKVIEDRTFNRVFSEINKGGKFAKIAGRR